MKEVATNVKKNPLVYIFGFIFLVLVVSNIISVQQLRKFRKLSESVRNELDNERDINRRLAETIGDCRDITTRIGELSQKDTTTIRGCIELVREIRKEVEVLAERCNYNNFGNDNLYNNNGGN